MPDSLPILSYTNKDFSSLKEELISKVPVLAPSWTNLNENDLGLALLNMVAGVGDMLAYYIDRSAEELYLPTARARESIKRIVKLVDYRLHRPIAARTNLRLTLAGPQAFNITIPRLTTVKTKKGIYFTTKEEKILFAGDTFVDVEGFQGELITDMFSSTGAEDQKYALSRPNAATNFLEVKVSNEVWVEDTRDLDFVESGLYVVDTDAAEIATLTFTRHLGNVPPQSATIEVTYLETKGADGNIGSGLATIMVTQFTNSGLLTVTNTVFSTGGKARESAGSARINAPRYLRTQNRAVTLKDYEDLLVVMEEVLLAQAVDHYGYVEVYVAPKGGADLYVEIPEITLTNVVDVASTLLADEYFVRVTALDQWGETSDWQWKNTVNDVNDPETDTRDKHINEKSITVASGEKIVVDITEAKGATSYRVYVGTVGGQVSFYGEAQAEGDGVTTLEVLSAPAAEAVLPPTENTTGVRSLGGERSLKQAAEEILELRRNIGCVFALYNPVYTTVDVSVSIRIYDNYYQRDVEGRVETALNDFFDESKQSFAQDVTLASLYQVIMDVEGARSAQFLDPLDDVVIGKGEVASAGAFTITLEGGIV